MSEENGGVGGMGTMPPANFLKSLCALSLASRIWFILWESGGAHKYTDILHIVGCSKTGLSDVLQELQNDGLVRMVGSQYQAISPIWLERARTHVVIAQDR